jgi:hypothetical protein
MSVDPSPALPTGEVRIPDLREPRRDAAEQQIHDMALSMQVDLDPDALVAAARRRTGLDDLGDPTLLDRLRAQVDAVEADTGLSGLGRFLIRRRLVGLLAARLLARIPGCDVTVADLDAARAPLAEAFGARFALPGDAPHGAELIVHATANPAGLNLALERAGFEARILEASWYGEALCPLPLGAAFHVNRLKLISTQVGHVGGAMRGRRTLRQRMETALALLEDPALDALLGAPVALGDLPHEMPRLLGLAGGSVAPCPVISYP